MSDSEVRVPRLLTTRQLAELTGLPRWRVFELIAQGKAPPHLRIGKTYRFPADAVADWIREQTQRAAMDRYERAR